MNQAFQQKPLAGAVQSAVMQINKDHDIDFLQGEKYSWTDLLTLKDNLANDVLQLVAQVQSLTLSVEVTSRLGDKLGHFTNLSLTFFNDVQEFSGRVAALRAQHEHLTGPINSIDEFNNYNRIAMEYHIGFQEIQSLLTPTIGEMMLILSELNLVVTQTVQVGA